MTTELWDQFVVSREQNPAAPDSFLTKSICGWTLRHYPSLRVHHVCDRANNIVGFVLGYLLEADGLRADGKPVVFDSATTADDEAIAAWIDSFQGRFVVVLVTQHGARAFLDGAGTLAAVFRIDRPLLASTTTLANYERLDDFVAERRAAGPVGANKFFPAGMTGTANTRRLMPNHVLDLDRSVQRRYWPTKPWPVASGRRGMLLVVGQIIDHIRSGLVAASKVGTVHVGLTAGRDSRVITSCARPIVDQVKFHTFSYDDPDKAADVGASIDLAARLGLDHRVLELEEPTEDAKEAYRLRTGYDANAGKAGDFYEAWLHYLPRDIVTINGYCGEVGRGYYYKSGAPTTRPDALSILKTIKLPQDDEYVNAVSTWLAGVPDFISPAVCMDLVYWELRAGCWALPQMYGAAPSRFYFVPIGHRYVLRRLLTFPVDVRLKQYVPQLIVEQAWNRASAIPYNGNIKKTESVFKWMKRCARRLVDAGMTVV